jgi:hypothetical protein
MKSKTRFVLGLCAAAILSTALSGCVVVPVPYRYGYHHHDYYRR